MSLLRMAMAMYAQGIDHGEDAAGACDAEDARRISGGISAHGGEALALARAIGNQLWLEHRSNLPPAWHSVATQAAGDGGAYIPTYDCARLGFAGNVLAWHFKGRPKWLPLSMMMI
jgi:hypothetical protein